MGSHYRLERVMAVLVVGTAHGGGRMAMRSAKCSSQH